MGVNNHGFALKLTVGVWLEGSAKPTRTAQIDIPGQMYLDGLPFCGRAGGTERIDPN